MATKKKMLQAAAGNAGGEALDITDVFSTYLYTGNATARSITNGIDLAGEGGLVWTKFRGSSPAALNANHYLFDTETTTTFPNKWLATNSTAAAATGTGSHVTSFNSNGWSMGAAYHINQSDLTYASWTFRKAPKFFDVVTYTGDGVAGRTVSHNLGSVPGMIIVKRTDSSASWAVYHKGLNGGTNPEQYYTLLDSTAAEGQATTLWNDTAPTSSAFTVGTNAAVNNHNNATYVAYLFAHNDGDGGFGPDGSDIIKCGSYTGTGTVPGNFIELGFEPQWVMVKSADQARPWVIVDNMRGMPVDGSGPRLLANDSAGEVTNASFLAPRATGFEITKQNTYVNTSGETYIYMAIRRGPLAQPESGTEVFAIDTRSDATSNPPSYSANGIVDMALQKELNASGWGLWDRLRGQYRLQTHLTNAEDGPFSYANFDHMDGWGDIGATDTTHSWMWKRAPGYFDVVTYTGNDTARTIQHNLGAVPEMIWVKSRSATTNWSVLHSGLNTAGNEYIRLNLPNAKDSNVQIWNGTVPTDTVFSVGASDQVNHSYLSATYIAYLFATVPGVSKVGSYTGNSTGNASGITQTIDCGFTSGARFVLIKKTNGTGSWVVFDTERGIISGNDPYLELNETAAESTATDAIDPHSSGFTLTSSTLFNGNGDTFIFYAIA